MLTLRRILIVCLLFGMLILGWLNWREVSTRAQLRKTAVPTVVKQPVHFASRTFDPGNPPADMPPLNSGENAECGSDFISNADLSGQTRQADPTHGTVTVTRIKVELQLNITIWVPIGVTQQVIDHEE